MWFTACKLSPTPEQARRSENPNQTEMWSKWLRHYERYRIASGLQNISNQEQVGTFLYAMGDYADDIVKMLSINEATVSFDEVKTALNGYFAARRKNYR